jgi:hypothetical protein
MANRCNATRRDGQPCAAAARPSGYCFYHDPAFAEQRAQGRRLGGYARSNVARIHRNTPPELRGVLDQLMHALDETYGGQLEPQVARAMATLSGAIVRMYEIGELAGRVQALEERDEPDDVYPRTRP